MADSAEEVGRAGTAFEEWVTIPDVQMKPAAKRMFRADLPQRLK